jgi:hypothetical protein
MIKAWVVDVNMGYGHQRTAYPLKDLAPKGRIISANDYQGIPKKDQKIWENSRKFYEFISNFKRIPLIGEPTFSLFDKFQKILTFYPKRDLSKPNLYLKQIFSLIKKGWGRDLIEKLKIKNEKLKRNLPLITTFFVPAFMAEVFNYPGDIFCVICDADIARSWASLNPSQSKIKYFAPNSRVVERLVLYGVKKQNIFLTGYPLPTQEIAQGGEERSSSTKENISGLELKSLKSDLIYRLLNLDPKKRYRQNYKPLIKGFLDDLPKKPNHPLTITFVVGGAGVQKEIGVKILKSLSSKIKKGTVKIILVAGIRKKVKEYFEENIEKLCLRGNKNIEIIWEKNIEDYFKKFNQVLRKTDILWTKPSELSFYTALGLPIIIAPTIGSQEDFNKQWLLRLGSAMLQENPNYTEQWLFDFLDSGWFAEAAMQGFIESEKFGTLNIKKIISKKT